MPANRIAWLTPEDAPEAFPPLESALTEPDGLLAAGGDLSGARLLYAYSHGIFPWYEEGQPILWWSPDPRCVLRMADFHVSTSLHRRMRRCGWTLTFNQSFSEVVQACAAPRATEAGTWITPQMALAYTELHADGWAHSLEVRDGERLVGGIYGLAIGSMFFGESMFSGTSDASKIALYAICRLLGEQGFELVDCQVVSAHLLSLGATTVPRSEFTALLQKACDPPTQFAGWPAEPLPVAALVPGA